MPEFIVIQQKDEKVGDTWFGSGVFGLNIGSSLNTPGPCPICGTPASTCIGETHADKQQPQAEPDVEEGRLAA